MSRIDTEDRAVLGMLTTALVRVLIIGVLLLALPMVLGLEVRLFLIASGLGG